MKTTFTYQPTLPQMLTQLCEEQFYAHTKGGCKR